MDPLAPLLASLSADGRLRVWSLVITVFGDAVRPRGGRVAAARLQRLMERLGVEAGALRTALSRLASDGWVERDREGRNSFYRLSVRGLGEFAPASGRIYAPARPDTGGDWTLALGGDPPGGAVVLGPGLWLVQTPRGAAGADAALSVTGRLLADPAALSDRLPTPDHREALSRLMSDLGALRSPPSAPLDAMAARVLLIHRWRRIVLRHPDLPDALLPPELRGARARVAAAYAALLPLSESWLDHDDAAFPAMPPANGTMAQRFQGP
ncbi:PaaX family transcriptional regulator C-terminal domain-containing protein [Acidimangrovimonas sediminis]|uniref:PaaX family transcriptional regulator C-terminal domain-containing protein n=1 Tax=Acidimangrovimonas sediminis TaxID=2056283 RepID=UPI000C809BC1|nr:PaaX family transcriptional regulator C-terminal domain-containing protein [Acidimangrovimonas sediminis]